MISSQDFDRLSAYIDNQLSAKEKAALEARLAREPELQATLNELRQTVQALRSLPVVKPPRNFMLSAKQVQAEPRRQWFPALRLATSLAGLLLVLVFAGDFIFRSAPTMSPAPQPQVTTVARSAALPTETLPGTAMPAAAAALPAQTEMLDQGATRSNLGAGAAAGSAPAATPPETSTPMSAAILAAPAVTAGATPGEPGAREPTLAAESALAPTEQPPALAPAGTAAPPAQAPAPLAPTQSPAVTEAPAPATPAPITPAAKSAVPQAAVPLLAAPTSTPAEVTESHAPAETLTAPAAEVCPAPTAGCVAAPATPSAPAPALPWRAAEIGLISLTVVLAVLTWLMRRR